MSKDILRILFWAAFIGKDDMVEKIIKQGYSPFIKSVHFKSKNAIMGAIEGSQYKTVAMILGFNYHTDRNKNLYLQKSKESRDHKGNNVLHLAYKNPQSEIHKLLRENQIGNEKSRNIRALAPNQMYHKRNLDDGTDNEFDYLILVKANRANFLID